MGVFRRKRGYYSHWAILQRTQVRSVDSVSASDESGNSEPEDDEVLVSEGEEVEEVDELAFEKLINSSLEQSKSYISLAPGP